MRGIEGIRSREEDEPFSFLPNTWMSKEKTRAVAIGWEDMVTVGINFILRRRRLPSRTRHDICARRFDIVNRREQGLVAVLEQPVNTPVLRPPTNLLVFVTARLPTAGSCGY